MNDIFRIEGFDRKRKLAGTIPVKGAKNAALKAMAAAVLFEDELHLENVPNIEDIARTVELLEQLGATVQKTGEHSFSIQVPENATSELSSDISKRFRASIVLTGPLLARFGSVALPHPGGCVIGKRPIDIFLDGFQKMGAEILEEEDCYRIRAPKSGLQGTELFLRVPSVTATETFLMAAVLAKGKTVIKNAALEPEIQDLARFLNTCGAHIEGIGTPFLTIEGGSLLRGKGHVYTTPPDRIEAGSFVILAALAGKDVTVENCRPEHFEALLDALETAGVKMEVSDTSIRVLGEEGQVFQPVDIKTHEYPGFPTDLQAPMSVFLTQANGESFVHETIFEGRLNYTEELVWMGADIMMLDVHRMLVKGPAELHGRELKSPDLRAGIAYVIAAIIAQRKSVIHNVYNIDRGYEKLEERLTALGARIVREHE
ncbi:MAG TPA: UDP-N-acetylglucosamine 1-carboxyvinyltransferase [Candidatus Paceibacterota bacterium]|nr:UDP-N-acetylglucosamine 1-carboxyvinyltransferase [Candidatus Paceibacterota bacterium]